MVSSRLIRIMEVNGMKTRLFSERMSMSPGSFPNQDSSQGAKCMIVPTMISMMPATTSQRATEPPP